MSIITEITKYEITDCCSCGVRFGVPVDLLEQRRKDKRNFYCPNGHPMVFTRSEADRLQAELNQKQKEIEARDQMIVQQQFYQRSLDEALAAERRKLSAQKGQITKLKTRASNGVCPCCNRTFKALAAHMKTKHPEFKSQA